MKHLTRKPDQIIGFSFFLGEVVVNRFSCRRRNSHAGNLSSGGHVSTANLVGCVVRDARSRDAK